MKIKLTCGIILKQKGYEVLDPKADHVQKIFGITRRLKTF